MTETKRIFTALGLLTLIGIIGCVEVTMTGCTPDKEKFERTVDLSAPTEGITQFKAAGENGAITARGLETNMCNITATITAHADTIEQAQALAEQTSVRLEPSGTLLNTVIDYPQRQRGENISVALDIALPRDMNLDLSSTNAKITVTDINGTTTTHTSNGKIELTNINGNITARTSNGAIEMSQITAETIDTHTSNGSIQCRRVIGHLKAGTSNGSITAVLSKDADPATNISMTTTNGSINLTVPPQYSAKVDASTVNGNIQTTLPIAVQGQIGKSLSGTVGSGQAKLSLKTTNGSIKINQLND